MTKFAFAICIGLVALTVAPLEATTSSSSPKKITSTINYWRKFIRHPLQSIQNCLKTELDSVLDVKNRNDRIKIMDTDDIFAKIESTIENIRRQLENASTVVNSTFGSDLANEQMASCKQIYQHWNDLGVSLRDLYSLCHKDGMIEAASYKESMRKTEHVFSDLREHRNMLETCANMKEFSSSHNSIGCTIWISSKLLLSYIADYPDVATYMESTTKLEELRGALSSGDRCVNTLGEKDFYKRAKTLKSDIERCVKVVGSRTRGK